MIKCRECGCLCDNSDIVGGICEECRGRIGKMRDRKQRAKMALESKFEQMRLEEILNDARTI